MRSIAKRVNRLEGVASGETLVGVETLYFWSDERKLAEATALALAAGGKPPFSFVFVIPHFGPGGPTEARLISLNGRMCE